MGGWVGGWAFTHLHLDAEADVLKAFVGEGGKGVEGVGGGGGEGGGGGDRSFFSSF